MFRLTIAIGICAAMAWFNASAQGEDAATTASDSAVYPSFGSIERKDPRLDKLIPGDARLEKLAEGFDWSEGPVWVPETNRSIHELSGPCLLFSDIPPNRIMKWIPGESTASVCLHPAGYTGKAPRSGEPGTNGLLLDPQGRLVACNHGDRCITLFETDGRRIPLADKYDGKRLNSPNDAVFHSSGDLYFTDPPYGLEKRWEDPARELDFCGVYRLSKAGQLALLTKEMTRPNGIHFSPDEKTLYVAQSDPEQAIWKAFDVKDDGTLGDGRVFFDVTDRVGKEKGLPDGLKVDERGNLFATGPGGVLVFDPDGTHLGTIKTGEATANCNWGDDGSTLYITADMYLARIKLTTKGKSR